MTRDRTPADYQPTEGIDDMKTVTIDPSVWAFIQTHDAAAALALVFVFAGLFAFGPKVIK